MVLSPERWPYLSGRVALFSRTDGTLRPEFTAESEKGKIYIPLWSDSIQKSARGPECLL